MGPQLGFLVLALLFLTAFPDLGQCRRNKSTGSHGTIPPKHNAVDLSGIEYCEKARYQTALKTTCPAGFTFEKLRPDCVCIRGIYRIYLDNCEIADGFIQGRSCTLPIDTKEGAKMHSMQLISEPNWERTHVVYEKPSVPGQAINTWDIATSPLNKLTHRDPKRPKPKPTKVTVATDADTFYTINGRAKLISAGEKQSICVEAYYHKMGSSNICHYFKSDNVEIWTGNSGNSSVTNNTIEITVQPNSCGNITNTTELKIQLLEVQECFEPLTDKNAECNLACDKEDEEVNEDLVEVRSRVSGLNCTEEDDYIKHDNDFLDRKLAQYALISQIKAIPSLRPLQPNRTFELYDRMIRISNRFCPDHYVPNVWVNHVMELFYILHKGREFKYEEILSDNEFTWLRDILDTCLAAEYEIELIPDPMVPEPIKDEFGDFVCEGDAEQAYGYCNATMDESDNCTAKVQIQPRAESTGANLKDKHYVPELAWNILDLTQAVCFKEFNDSYRMFHVLEQAAEKLFTVQIKNLWYYPGYHGGSPVDHRKEKLLGLGADEIMYNMDICVSSAYSKMTRDQIPRLLRLPKYPRERQRKKRSVSNKPAANAKNPVCVKTKSSFTIPPTCIANLAASSNMSTLPGSGNSQTQGVPDPVTPDIPENEIPSTNPDQPSNPGKPDPFDDYAGNYVPPADDLALASRIGQTLQEHENHKQSGGGSDGPSVGGTNDYPDYAGNHEAPAERRRRAKSRG